MAFDVKKEYKEYYLPKNKPEIVTVSKAHYIAVRGKGDPNEEGGAYQKAIGVLYAIAYTIKMSYKTDYRIAADTNYKKLITIIENRASEDIIGKRPPKKRFYIRLWRSFCFMCR